MNDIFVLFVFIFSLKIICVKVRQAIDIEIGVDGISGMIDVDWIDGVGRENAVRVRVRVRVINSAVVRTVN